MRTRFALIALLALALASCSGSDDDDTATQTISVGTVPEWEEACPGASQLVLYKAEGTARRINYTIELPSGTSQGSDRRIPLMNQGGGEGIGGCFDPGAFVYASFQNETDTGTVTCIIERDGQEVARVQSSGAYVIAQCDA